MHMSVSGDSVHFRIFYYRREEAWFGVMDQPFSLQGVSAANQRRGEQRHRTEVMRFLIWKTGVTEPQPILSQQPMTYTGFPPLKLLILSFCHLQPVLTCPGRVFGVSLE